LPSNIAHQWLYVYDKGKIVFPSIAITSSLRYSYVAYVVRNKNNRRRLNDLYLTAAALIMMIGPYTGVLMLPISNKLGDYARCSDSIDQDKGKERRPDKRNKMTSFLH
jgi:hypothetical protein